MTCDRRGRKTIHYLISPKSYRKKFAKEPAKATGAYTRHRSKIKLVPEWIENEQKFLKEKHGISYEEKSRNRDCQNRIAEKIDD